MKIQTLKDLKIALQDVPDEILDEFGAGFSEEPYVELLVYGDEEDFGSKWDNIHKNYPTVNDVNKWIQNISNVTKKIENDEHYDGIGFEEAICSEDTI